MVADYERTRDALIRLVGLRVLEDSRLDDPAIGRRGGMAWLGDNIIEIGEPIVDGGAVDRFVRRFGSHMSSIAVQVADIDATVAFLAERGVRVASRVDGHIVFTHPADTAGVVIEWFGAEEHARPAVRGVTSRRRSTPVLAGRADGVRWRRRRRPGRCGAPARRAVRSRGHVRRRRRSAGLAGRRRLDGRHPARAVPDPGRRRERAPVGLDATTARRRATSVWRCPTSTPRALHSGRRVCPSTATPATTS